MWLKYGDKRTFPVLQILYPHLDYKNSKFHIDHIYPKSKFKKNLLDRDYSKNHIYNLQLLSGEENLHKKDKDPEDWINEYCKSEEEKKEYKRKNYIDENFNLSWENNEKFDEMRCEKMKKKLLEELKLL